MDGAGVRQCECGSVGPALLSRRSVYAKADAAGRKRMGRRMDAAAGPTGWRDEARNEAAA
jgi:hypothetical protein